MSNEIRVDSAKKIAMDGDGSAEHPLSMAEASASDNFATMLADHLEKQVRLTGDDPADGPAPNHSLSSAAQQKAPKALAWSMAFECIRTYRAATRRVAGSPDRG